MADPAHDELNERLDDMIKRGKQVNRDWEPLARDALDYLFGNQLKDVKDRDGWDRIQANYIFPAVTQQMALMSQRRPTVVVQPFEESDVEFANFWRGLEQRRFDRTLRMNILGIGATLDAAIHGHYVAKVYWEPKADWNIEKMRWTGEPKVTLMRPDYCGADPDAEVISREGAEFVYCSRRMLLTQALARWSDKAAEIKAEARETREQEDGLPGAATFAAEWEHRVDGQTGKPVSAVAHESQLVNLLRRARDYQSQDEAGGQVMPGDEDLPRYVTVTEVFFRDDETRSGQETEPITLEELIQDGAVLYDADPETGQVYRVAEDGLLEGKAAGDQVGAYDDLGERVVREWDDEPVYPRGRVVLRIGKLILNPEAKASWDDGGQVWPFRQWPYIVGVNQVLPHVWQGLNSVVMPRTLQDWKNIAFTHMANYIKFFSSPITLMEEGAITKGANVQEAFRARAGAVWKLLKGGIAKVKREPPTPLGQGLLNINEVFTRDLQDQTGMQDVSRGRQAKGQATLGEIQELARSSRVRTSMAAVLQDDWMENIMRLVGAMDQRYLNPDDHVQIVGEGAALRMAQVSEGQGPEGHDVEFDLTLKIGTALPYDQQRRKEEIMGLMEAVGPALLPELLDAFEIENKDEVLERHAMWQQFEQFMEEQEKLAKQGAGGTA